MLRMARPNLHKVVIVLAPKIQKARREKSKSRENNVKATVPIE